MRDPMLIPFKGLPRQPKKLEHYSHEEIFAEYQQRWVDDPEGMLAAVSKLKSIEYMNDGIDTELERDKLNNSGLHGGGRFDPLEGF